MQMNQRTIFWLSVITVALQGLTSVSWGALPVHIDPHWFTFGASLISYAQGVILFVIGSQGMKLPSVAPVVKPVLLAAALLTSSLLMEGSAYAQQPKPAPINDPFTALRQFTIDDLNAALADAQANNDLIAAGCWQALIPLVQNNAANPLPSKPGAALAFQKARNFKRKVQAGIPEAVTAACAPLILDAQQTILGIGAAVGLRIVNPLHIGP